MSNHLLTQRRFAGLFWCQFFSAFNDNFLKNTLVFLILFKMAGADAEALVTLSGVAFIAPCFLLSGLGGQLADRFDKALIARHLKLAEVGASAVAVAGFLMQSVPVLFAALFLFGVINALFGPVKYGILPDHLRSEELPAGNALVEGGTFIAILLGTMVGGIAARGGGDPLAFGALMMLFASLCWASSLFIPPSGEAAPDLVIDRNIARSSAALLADLWSETRLWRCAVMVSLFWLMGAIAMSLLPTLVKNTLGGDEIVATTYLALFAVAIALGSGIASWLASGRIVLLPVPVASLVLTVFAADLAWTVWGYSKPGADLDIAAFFAVGTPWRVGIDLFGLAVAGGIFIVPAFAALQSWAPVTKRARVVAGVNVLSAAFIALGCLGVGLLQSFGLDVAQLFLLLAGIAFVSAVWIFRVLPTSAFRDLISIIYRAFYRVEIKGLENIAKAGPNAVIALNHTSFLDAGLALSMLEKDPVFAIHTAIAKRWWVKPFLRFTRAMPIDPTKPLATRSLIQAVRDGDTLIIFPEGRLTVTGSLMKVYDGAGLIAVKSGVKVVPVRLEGFEGTMFSLLKPDQVRKRWFPKVRVTVLEPVDLKVDQTLKGKARRQAAGAALYEIMSDLVFRTTPMNRTIFQAVVEAARAHGKGRLAMQDPIAGELSYRRLLVGANVIGRKLAAVSREGEAIGVMLPNSNGAAVTILGLMSSARVPAMINFTAGAANVLAACKAARIKTIVTARSFIEKGRLDKLVTAIQGEVKLIHLEDVRAGVSFADKAKGFLDHEKPIARAKAGDRAAILFTSGSEGTPKGVVLSHRNILANAAQAAARIDFGRQDKVFNVLPVFHSFGLTVGLVMPLVSGVPVFVYPSPLHYRIVPELVYDSNSTIMFGTDTFLTGYARAAHPYDFRSLRYVLAGAEPVKDTTRRVWMEKFGLRILEGYGVTETAPVLAINTPMFNRFGTVGRLMPGMEARLEAVPGVEEGGRLHVRGANVMLGYLRVENPGVLEVPSEGWHDTGDIVAIDREGFITIKGRAKRFAKIGGEMISMAAVEALAAEVWPQALSAVGSVADARKGERLVLLTKEKAATRAAFQELAKSRGASDLMIPSEIIVVDDLPLLGSGKVDFVGVARLIKEHVARTLVAA